eukprot:g64380.t1
MFAVDKYMFVQEYGVPNCCYAKQTTIVRDWLRWTDQNFSLNRPVSRPHCRFPSCGPARCIHMRTAFRSVLVRGGASSALYASPIHTHVVFHGKSASILPFPQQPCRGLAKKVLKTGKKAGKSKLDLEDSPIELKDTKEKMGASFAVFVKSIEGLRVGRATPALIQAVPVQAWGGTQPLASLASIAVRGANTLVVTAHDQTVLDNIVTAVREAGLDLQPHIESNKVVVPVPKATGELRQKLIKDAKNKAEECRTKIRAIRHKIHSEATKDSSLSKDELARAKTDIQTLTDMMTTQVDEALAKKEADILNS